MEYLFTERAHLACPNMCFGIAACIRKAYDKGRVEVIFSGEICDKGEEAVESEDSSGTSTDGDSIVSPKIIKEFEKLTAGDWNLFNEGFLKIVVWEEGAKTVLLFVFHHLLADGRGALGLIQKFADFYVDGIEPKAVPEHLITKEDLPVNSKLSFISRALVNYANRQWKKEKHQLSYEEYHTFADKFLQGDDVEHSISVVHLDKLTKLYDQCKVHNVSINDYLLAKMFTEEKANSIVMAYDLRKQLACYNQGALGNYATAFSVRHKQGKHADSMKTATPSEIFYLAQKVHNQIQKKLASPKDLYLVLQCYASLEPGLLDAAMISSRGAFDSKAAKFIGTTFFNYDKAKGYSITNLGKIESKNIESAFFIPPASPAIKKTQGVLTVNGVMRICTSQRKNTDLKEQNNR